jgi:hypothetical protein
LHRKTSHPPIFRSVQHIYNRALHRSTPIFPFRWVWDFNHWVPLMLHYTLHPQRKNHPMLNMRKPKPLSLLNELRTSGDRSMIFYRNPMLSANSAMINTECHTSFRWETRSGSICRKSTLQDPIKIFIHFAMYLTP